MLQVCTRWSYMLATTTTTQPLLRKMASGRTVSHQACTAKSSVPYPDRFLFPVYNSFSDYYSTKASARHHPDMLRTYLDISSTMHRRGMIPLVHGRSAMWYVSERIYRAFGRSGLRALRPPSVAEKGDHFVRSLIAEKTKEKCWLMFSRFLPDNVTIKGKLDHDTLCSTHLLSTTIGLFHDEFRESALSFVYGGQPSKYTYQRGNTSMTSSKCTIELQNAMIQELLVQNGYDPKTVTEFLRTLEPLYWQADKLIHGHILVVGVPFDKIDTYTYHSGAYGHKTHRSMHEVLALLESKKMPKEGCQVRLLLHQDTFDPKSGIEVVNLMDGDSYGPFLTERFPIDEEMQATYEKEIARCRDIKASGESEASQVFKKELDDVIEKLRTLLV